jgi:hypothetical protein
MSKERLTNFGKSLTPEQNKQFDEDYRAGYADARARRERVKHDQELRQIGYDTGYHQGLDHCQPHRQPPKLMQD